MVPWPVPFADGLERLMAFEGRRTVALASGDPFWFGAGRAIAARLPPGAWRALPGPSSFSLAAARLGWGLEGLICLGLHAAPLERLRPHLAPGARALVTLRDGAAPEALARWLVEVGFGATRLWLCEALGGPRERIREGTAEALAAAPPGDIAHPVLAALEVAGPGPALARAAGLPDALFESDGQITKRPVRALTLSALAPLPGAHLWDIGAGTGSISIEWLLAHPGTAATAIEARADRAARARRNACRLGVDRLAVVEGRAPEALAGLARPDAVFIGGGVSEAVLAAVWAALPPGGRLVANAVTVESEALLLAWQGRHGGEALRIALSGLAPLGPKRAWQAAYPLVQWSVTR